MTNFEYELLRRIRDERISVEDEFSIEENAAFQEFQSNRRGWVYITPRTLYFQITARGVLALKEHEELLQAEAEKQAKQEEEARLAEQAEDKRWRIDDRRSWLQFWLSILFSFIGFVGGVFIEHYFAILELICAIF